MEDIKKIIEKRPLNLKENNVTSDKQAKSRSYRKKREKTK